MRPGTCIHFSGIQNDGCDAGHKYLDVAVPLTGEQVAWHNENYPELDVIGTAIAHRIPCFVENGVSTCSDYREPSLAEIDQFEAEINNEVSRSLKALKAVIEHLTAINAPRGTRGNIPCPICGTGELHFSRARYNGHISAKCTAAKCVEWMQ